MFIHPDISIKESIHNLINLHLFPECVLRLGQTDRYSFRDATIALERTGNLYSSGKNAMTVRYNLDGPGFNACLLAVWRGEDQATADVEVVAIGPDSTDAQKALREWLLIAVDARMPPRDAFAGMHLV